MRAVVRAACAVAGCAAMLAAGVSANAQVAAPGTAPMRVKSVAAIEPQKFATYDNRWDFYGGLLYMNGQAGQDLSNRFNMGGGEVMATYWLGSKKVKTWGVAGDYRFGAGTTQAAPAGAHNPYNFNRILVMESMYTGGVVYRTPFRNRYAAVDAHALAGATSGIFDHSIRHYPDQSALNIAACPAEVDATHPVSLGTYCNHTAPYAFTGISIDFNDTAKLAFRLQPDLVFEHYGTETREFFSISLGVMYRYGGPKK